ncbi:MAG TPA: ATP-dependent DNA ligase [Gemmatimonadales bacterium]|nr:ATP-dependent DNA ligase [Gemmatimonadales bacterium]
MRWGDWAPARFIELNDSSSDVPLKLASLVETSRRVAEASGRRDKIGLLAALLTTVPPPEIEIATAYLSGAVRQDKLGVGWAALQAAASGPAVESSTVVLAEVDATLELIARASGKGSAETKQRLLRELLGRMTADEQQFFFGLIMGELRQGAVEGLVIEAVAHAAGVPATDVRRAVMMAGDVPRVAKAALVEGLGGLAAFAVQLFRPVLPMLAGTAESEAEALGELGEAALEYKLDGARVQIHKAGDEIRVYSRRLNEVTPAVPELVEAARAMPARELILEGESIALRPDGTPHPFQTTMSRFGRRLEVERTRGTTPLTLFLFDLLYLDGVPLIDEPLYRRSAELVKAVPAEFLVPRLVTASVEEAREFLAASLGRGHEGIMAKAVDSVYEAGRRGRRWLKVKPVRTLDLVVLAAEWGHGRRRGWLSNLHLGARDSEHGGFVMLGKTFKGMTDEMLAWQTERLQELEVSRDGHTVYVRPELVVEVAFNDLQSSPQYPGGLALRFARIKGYRPDKSAAEADTMDTLREIWRRQTGVGPPEV